ncbi:NERD domain-containing protein [Bacteroides sp. BFG-638]|uniref:NERD domain-containing protein n=1 Tax=Bacteroides sp. BFG-638 TaxID=2972765 RepID=UPI0021658D06|nr:NERD domain-containing protein [Bacteroides sp. BFG-638]MCS2947073.1 NERD domain-containing protein [Bacteroides sp. BFG-638]
MIVDHTEKSLSRLEYLITKDDGTPLQGEIDMYRRIVHDCENSSITWHFWHDINLHIQSGRASEIQIDFLLISELGAIVVEVKGGAIQIEAGKYFYQNRGILTPMGRSPFQQAEDYQWAIIKSKVINGEEVFVDHVCAFPHATLDHTSSNPAQDLSYKMWNKNDQDSDKSFAEFCIDILKKDKQRKRWTNTKLSSEVLNSVINSFTPTIKDSGRYRQSSLKDILNWLNISNLDALESLQRNHRVVIEGGPGTGKTTIAKAFIKKNKGLRGLYLCWTKLLAAQIKYTLQLEGLLNCEVESYTSYMHRISKGNISINELSLTTGLQELESTIEVYMKGQSYDYVIIDEAQDVADKGMIVILRELTSLQHTGLQTGRFLVLYDIEQGYNSGTRNLESAIDDITRTSAHFTINGNKRVPTNIEIVRYANELLDLKPEEVAAFWNAINNDESACKIHVVNDSKTLTRVLKQKRKELTSISPSLQNSTILVHSDLLYPINGEQDSVYDKLTYSDSVIELSIENIHRLPEHAIGLSTILKYKGLENENIILVIPIKSLRSSFDNFLFEIYVGMTRAIMNIDIFILNT